MTARSTVPAQTNDHIPEKVISLGQNLDNRTLNKYDPRYIEVPQHPWRLIMRTKMDRTITDFINTNTLVAGDENNDTRMSMLFDSGLNTSVGLWIGYRGLGIGYSYKLNKKEGINLTVSGTGAKFGINFRLRSMKVDQFHLNFDVSSDDSLSTIEYDARFLAPMNVTSFFLNGYYVFNSKRYSQAAAYNQVVIQKKSAGSFLMGATLYASIIDMAHNNNAGLIALADSVGYISIGKISLGAGYGYNWVPAKGWTVNAMIMPYLSLSDNLTVNKYDCNYSFITQADSDDYGTWDNVSRRWSNGEQKKPIIINNQAVDWVHDADMWQSQTIQRRTCLALNLDIRVGAAYCWDRYFISANALFNNFTYGNSKNKVYLVDWYTTISLGIRL